MTRNVVQLDTAGEDAAIQKHLSEEEQKDFLQIANHPSALGHVLFGSDAGVIYAKNIDEDQVAAFANVFDICDELTAEIGQKSHASTVLESKKVEITCHRFENAYGVVMQSKGGPRKAGG